jgi:hypothetical protein
MFDWLFGVASADEMQRVPRLANDTAYRVAMFF